jgi:hypothetical protein
MAQQKVARQEMAQQEMAQQEMARQVTAWQLIRGLKGVVAMAQRESARR